MKTYKIICDMCRRVDDMVLFSKYPDHWVSPKGWCGLEVKEKIVDLCPHCEKDYRQHEELFFNKII